MDGPQPGGSDMPKYAALTRGTALALLALAAGPVGAAAPDGTKPDSRALSRAIDQALDARLRAEKVRPSPRADGAEFLRRVYLDVTGRTPPAEKATAFLADRDPNKRAKLIDQLLDGPEYGKHQADVWQALLLPRNSDNRRIMQFYPNLVRWLEDGFNSNKPWDRLVHDLVTASGEVDKNGAVVYFLANPTPDKVTDNVTRLFLGVQLQCAQCHNHPFTDWKQTEYWGMAAFFTKVRTVGRPAQVARNGGTLSINETGPGRPARLPDSAKVVPAKFLQGEQAKLGPRQPARPVVADWMTSPKNPFFAKAMVNRTWAQFFGRGIVNPVDDMHEGNVPSHPQLLADLARQFADGGFDLKSLIRAVCNSQAYQRTSKPSGGNADAAPELFARMAVKVLTPEQLYDSLTRVLGAPNRPAARQGRPAAAAARRPGAGPRAAFVAFFGVEDGNTDPTEYQAGIPQVLRLMNSPQLNNAAMLNPLLRANKAPGQIVDHLYVATLARHPTPQERGRCVGYVSKYRGEARQAYADVLWALLNSSEFTLNH
jgi:hypothetical protein